MIRERIVAIILSAAALGVCFVLGTLEPGSAAAIAFGLALLAFWSAGALRAGRAVAVRVNPEARRAGRALWTFVHAYLFILVSVCIAAVFGRIDAVGLTLLAAIPLIGIKRGRPLSVESGGGDSESGGVLALVRRHPLAAIIVTAIGLITAANVAWALLLPPFAQDDFTYHLVFPVEWAQSGTLNMRAVPFGNHSPPYYPMNTELFWVWLLVPFRQLFHINAAQSVFFVLSVVASYEIFRRCHASRRASLIAASLFGFCPVVVAELAKGYVDVAFGCFFLVALNAILAFERTPSAAKALQIAVGVGLFAGTKIPGVVFTLLVLAPLTFVVLIVAWRRIERTARPGAGSIAAILAAAGAVFVAAGGWWYVRNLIVARNPVFPLNVKVLGRTLFEGAYNRTALPESRLSTLLDLYTPTLLALFAAAALFAVGAALFKLISPAARAEQSGSDRARPGAVVLFGLVLPAVIAAIFHFLLPFDYARFVLALGALSAAGLLVPLDAAAWPVRRTTELLILVALGAGLWIDASREALFLPLMNPPRLASSSTVWGALGLGALTFLCLPLLALRVRRLWPRLAARTLSGALLFALFCVGSTVSDSAGGHYVDWFRKSRDHITFVAENYEGVTIAFCGSNRTLPYYGRTLSNRVCYVNVNRGRDWFFHDHVFQFSEDKTLLLEDRNGVAYYRRHKHYPAWIANLDAAGADLLIADQLVPWNRPEFRRDRMNKYVCDQQYFPIESIWAERHTEKFRCVYASPIVRIYEIRQ